MDVIRIEVEIHELVLHGFDRLDGRAVAGEVELALAARLAAGVFEPRSAERVDAGSFRLSASPSPGAIGSAVAGRVHRSLGP
jgi:hypothetical protein